LSAGKRGQLIESKLHENACAIAVRTYLFDSCLPSRESSDMSVHLAVGLDSRPYRLQLPASLHWVEVYLPELTDSKRDILSAEKSHCPLDIVKPHFGDEPRRRHLCSERNRRGECAMVISEELLTYLDEGKVTSLASDPHDQPHFICWLVGDVSPRALEWVNCKCRYRFEAANSPMTFAPSDWRKFPQQARWGNSWNLKALSKLRAT
jgi:hypothetical protein